MPPGHNISTKLGVIEIYCVIYRGNPRNPHGNPWDSHVNPWDVPREPTAYRGKFNGSGGIEREDHGTPWYTVGFRGNSHEFFQRSAQTLHMGPHGTSHGVLIPQ